MPKEYLFFSIIIPAHNEEGYICNTLQHIKELNYPINFFEVIVIENASTDDTYVKAKEFQGGNIEVLSSLNKGTSKAKNIGIEKLSKKSDWTLFLDADTFLEKDFLKDLNNFLIKYNNKNYSAGTTKIKPLPSTIEAQFWFIFQNLGHMITKTSFSLHIIKSSFLIHNHFNEGISFGEDVELMKDVLKSGKFFYFSTNYVSTSTRRFEKEGWLNILFSWVFVGILPPKFKKRFTYKVIR